MKSDQLDMQCICQCKSSLEKRRNQFQGTRSTGQSAFRSTPVGFHRHDGPCSLRVINSLSPTFQMSNYLSRELGGLATSFEGDRGRPHTHWLLFISGASYCSWLLTVHLDSLLSHGACTVFVHTAHSRACPSKVPAQAPTNCFVVKNILQGTLPLLSSFICILTES